LQELSKLDEQMAKAYQDALASLSPQGQKETREYQRQWLKGLSYIKAERDKLFAEDKEHLAGHYDEDIAMDLRIAYEKRIKQLQESLIKFSDRIFRNVYDLHWDTDKKYCPDERAKKELIYPQIENPRDENEKFWDTVIAQKAHKELKIDDGCTDTEVVYDDIFSSKHVISLINERVSYGHGAAHAYTFISSLCWLLEAKRKLQTSDLFDDKTDWRAKLVALVRQKLNEEESADKETFEIEPSRLVEIVTSADHWVILKEGLGIQFRQYELGSQGNMPYMASISIDWKTLDPYLSKKGHSLIYD
jgi:hypothetical protein